MGIGGLVQQGEARAAIASLWLHDNRDGNGKGLQHWMLENAGGIRLSAAVLKVIQSSVLDRLGLNSFTRWSPNRSMVVHLRELLFILNGVPSHAIC